MGEALQIITNIEAITPPVLQPKHMVFTPNDDPM